MLTRRKNARKATLAQITSKINRIEPLLKTYKNLDEVLRYKDPLDNLITAFDSLHQIVQDLLPDEEKDSDHNEWYLPRFKRHKSFRNRVKKWLENAPPKEKGKEDESASVSGSRASTSSTGSVIRREDEAKKAEALALAAALEKRLELEKLELEIKAKKERLALDTEIAV